MNSKQVSIVLGVVVVVLLAVVGYMALRDNSQTETLSQQNTAPNNNLVGNNANTAQSTNTAQSPTQYNETANWKTYTDSSIGISFKYPSNWTVGGYNKSPNVEVYSSLISSLQTECGELGTCQQYERSNKKVIEDGSMSGIISFNGGKGSLIATCSGNEGGDLVPTPFYKFKFFKGERLYEISLNDLPTKLSANSDCNSSKYLQDVIKAIPNPISDTKYKTYNDLLTMIKQTLVLK